MDTEQKNIKDIASIANTSKKEVLKYSKLYKRKTIVIKYGGHAMGDKKLSLSFAKDVVILKNLGVNPVIVHGGGPQIGLMLDKLKIKSSFHNGLRITSKEIIDIVEMVLAGSINKNIVSKINTEGDLAIGLSGKDANLIIAKKLVSHVKDPSSNIEKVLDIGFVGEPIKVNPSVIHTLSNAGFIPVISPIGVGLKGETFNINADTAAGAIASALNAERILLLTDVAGVLDKNKKLISNLSKNKIEGMIKNNIITGGMIPKIRTCLDTLSSGSKAAVIIDGRVPNAILKEILTDVGYGTMIS
ncbi:MAG: Acetylglutamate kinase [Alphaproteobacteria bacterium MarineAlpha9_Bin2]|nr:MAG: Acetylglutamate kinase [Alphaproteobacteria bacterium MarineAlpha9_Bin2]